MMQKYGEKKMQLYIFYSQVERLRANTTTKSMQKNISYLQPECSNSKKHIKITLYLKWYLYISEKIVHNMHERKVYTYAKDMEKFHRNFRLISCAKVFNS